MPTVGRRSPVVEHSSADEKGSDFLKSFRFHGVDLRTSGREGIGDCPFCGREGKLNVKIETGQWRCWVCSEGQHETSDGPKVGGNVLSFLRCLWQRSFERTNGHTQVLAKERRLLWPDTLTRWGVARSITTGDWLLPGWGIDGKFGQLYKWQKTEKGMILKPTPEGIGHRMLGPQTWDRKAATIWLAEGPWDGMALWEVLRSAKQTENGFASTGSETSSLLAGSAVLAIPGCGSVGTPFVKWLPLFAGKKVILLFDSDHPRKHDGRDVPPAGFDAAKRAVRILSTAERKPSRVEWLEWGIFGYDPSEKSGFDVRDLLSRGEALPERIELLSTELLPKIKPVPPDWLSGSSSLAVSKPGSVQIEPAKCESWAELKNCWRKAMEWSDGLEKALAAMLACVLSTRLSDDPLWIKVMSPASTGKSTLCEALACATDWVFPLSKMTGMHSGWKSDKKGEEDHGLVPLVMNKTLVIKDGDTLLTSADPSKVFGELRDLFDGAARVHYLHGVSRRYDNVRLGIIICGTDSLRKIDSSELGERFLDVVMMEKIDEESERTIGLRTFWRVIRNATENGDESVISTRSKEMLLAMRMTAGYVNHLREHDADILHRIEVVEDTADRCNDLGKFVSCLRARPSRHQEEHSSRELSSRLVGQIGKLAICLSGVYQKRSIDETVMRQVRQIALDTARGTTLDMARFLFRQGAKGSHRSGIATVTNQGYERVTKLLKFLRAIGVADFHHRGGVAGVTEGQERWKLTERMRSLFERVMKEDGK